MSTAVIMISSYDPGYLTISEHLVRTEIAAGNVAIAFDVSALMATPVDSYHRGVLKIFGINFPGHDIESRMTQLGARFVRAGSSSGCDEVGPLDSRHENLLDIAVQSALITFFRTDRPDQSKRLVRKIGHALREEGRAVYRISRSLCREYPDISVVYLPNGRFPHQKLATLAFQDEGVRELHIEKGEGSARAYVQDYAPQDRLGSQNAVETVLAGVSRQRINEVADAWLAKRSPSEDSRNEFSVLWDESLPHEITAHKEDGIKIAGFFTSSQDEFQFLGPDWQLHEWDDQFTAFDLVMTQLEADGYACYIRVHPNLATKAHECFIRERNGIRHLAARHPDLKVIWHDDQTNTYSLLGASDVAVVWDSTVGLEASARGLPVWTTATSRYGLIADVRELLSVEDVRKVGLDPWRVDTDAAKRFIAYLVLRDQDIDSKSAQWTSWNAAYPPLGVRLAAAAVSGGIPGIRNALWSQIDVYRHRGLRANLMALKRK